MGSVSTLVRQCLLLTALVAVVAVFAPPSARLWVAIAGVVVLGFFVIVSYCRHREIRRLTAQIDEVLHAGRSVQFEKCREGDVAVLTNELEKMVSRLGRTTLQLQQERSRLADSLADVSHQIRTPLTAAELMLASIEREEDLRGRKRLLRQLEGQLERISWLVTTLLKIAKVDAGAIRVQSLPVNLAQCVKWAAAPLEAAMDLCDVALRITVDSAIMFTGDELWTAEAVENILKNCMEKTPAGGAIVVTAADTPLVTTLKVTDTGPGIAEEDLPHIFDRFYCGAEGEKDPTAAHTPEGFGIGLSLAQALISVQGGTLQAANRPEGGAEFTITFPKLVV